MEDNPYSVFVDKIRKDTSEQLPAMFRMGKILSAEPLKIEVAGTIQTAGALMKNNALNVFLSGEQVLLIPIEDEQRYIILCKVVSA